MNINTKYGEFNVELDAQKIEAIMEVISKDIASGIEASFDWWFSEDGEGPLFWIDLKGDGNLGFSVPYKCKGSERMFVAKQTLYEEAYRAADQNGTDEVISFLQSMINKLKEDGRLK